MMSGTVISFHDVEVGLLAYAFKTVGFNQV